MPMNDDSMVKIMQSLGLDYSPAERSIKSFEGRIAALNKQLFEMKANAIAGAKDINQAFSSQLGGMGNSKAILDQFGQPLKTVQTESKKAAVGLDSMSTAYTKSSKAAHEHAKSVQNVAHQYNTFGSEMQRRVSWFVTGGLFYGGIAAGKETIKTISEVEMGVTQIARVMEDSAFVFKDYRNELLQLGVDYGQTFDKVQDIALRWAQAGYNVKDSLENTKTSLLALNTAELDASNATESMIGIMAQWNLTSAQLSLVLDKINKTADDFTVTSQDLVDGLLRSSGAAKIMGLSLEQTISLLTVMREASGRTGREVGNALNSIISYMQRPIAIKTFESNGIEMFADKAKTQFRDVMEVFQEVYAKWNTLSPAIQDGFVKSADDAGLYNEELANAIGTQQEWNDLQQRDLSQAAAGVYRRNYFIGMIERLSNAQNVLNGMTDAAGYSQTENARTMETLEKKYQSMLAAAQELAVALGDAGLLDLLKDLTDTTKNAADAFSKMNPEMKALVVTSLELLGVLKAIKSIGGLVGTEATLGKLVSIAPGWTKIIPLIGAAAIALGLYASNLKSAEGNMSEQDRALGELGDKYIAAKSKIDSLKSGTEEYNTAQSNMQKIMTEIAQKSPELITALGDHAEITGIDDEAIRKLAEAYGILKEAQDKHIGNLQDLTDEQIRLDRERLTSTVETLQKQLRAEKVFMDWYDVSALPEDKKRKATNPLESVGNFLFQNGIFNTGIGEKGKGWGKDPIEELEKETSQTIKDLDEAMSKLNAINGEINKNRPELNIPENAPEWVKEAMRKSYAEKNKPSGAKTDTSLSSEFSDGNLKSLYNANKLTLKEYLEKLRNLKKTTYSEYLNKSAKDINDMLNNPATAEKTKAYLSLEGDIQSASDKANSKKYTTNEALANALKKIDYTKSVSEVTQKSIKQEIDALNLLSIKHKSSMNADERMDLEKRIYDASKELQEKKYEDAVKVIEINKSMSEETQASIQMELEGYIKIRNTLKLTSEQKLENEKNIYDTSKKLQDKKLEDILDFISTEESIDNLSLKDKLRAYQIILKTQGDNAEAVKAANKGIYDTQKEINDKAIKDAKDLSEKKKKLQDEELQNSENWIKHQKDIGRLSAEEELAAWNRVLVKQNKNIEAVNAANKGIFDVYKDLLKEQQDAFKDAYDERIDSIEKEADKQKEKQQVIIDGIEAEEKALDRTESTHDFNNKKAELEKDLAYWKVRTSKEASQKVIDIQKQLDEENHDREVELQKQGLDDKKETARKEIDNIEATAKKEKEKWELAYKDLEKAFSVHNIDLIAQASTTSKNAYKQWVDNYLIPMQNALKTGNVDEFGNASGDAGDSLNRSKIYNLASSIVDLKRLAESGDPTAYESAKSIYDQLEKLSAKDAAQLHKMNYQQSLQYLSKLPKAHGGAESLSYGAAYLKPGELIFPPTLSADLKALISVVRGGSSKQIQSSTTLDNSRRTEIKEVLHVDNMYLGDETDSDILSRQLGRVVASIK
jgi:hypothetical protein